MSFQTLKACSVGDEHFADRDLFKYFGLLDEFSDDGILISRAADSIIFGDEAAGAGAEGAKGASEGAQAAMKQAEEAIEASAPSKASDDQAADEAPFAPDPALSAAIGGLGEAPEQAGRFEQHARAALALMAFNRALFSMRDLEKAISKAGSAAIVAHADWAKARPALLASLGLTNLTPEQPLGPNTMVTPTDFMELEAEMIELASRETDEHSIPPELIDEVLASKPTMAEEQRVAAIASCSGNKAVVVTEGTAGAGKSFTLNAIREVYEKIPAPASGGEIGYDIIGTALSWTATKVLEESAGLSGGRAIQGLTMAMDEAKAAGGDFFKRRTILIVDEAGLVGVKHMHKILWHAKESKHPVRVLLTGDSLQLCPVEAGNALEAIVDECGSSRLDTIRRQKQASHRAAVKHFCYGRAENGLFTFWQQEAVHFSADADERRELVMRDYVRYCVSNPQDIALVLALENAEVKRLNDEIRARLKLVGRLLGDEHEIQVTDGRGAFKAMFCVGDQIVLRKNKVDHPVFKSRFEKIFQGAAAAQRAGENQATRGAFGRMVDQWKAEKASNPEEGPEELRKGIFNRTVGIIVDIKKNPEDPKSLLVRCLLNEGGEIELDTGKYFDDKAGAVPFHHNFATTIYASQGQTVQKVLIMDSPYMNRRLAYVGMSRHTMMCDIYADCSEIESRVAKDGARKVEQAWKRFEKDTKSERGPEQMRLAKLRTVVSEWEQAGAGGFKARDYLRAMANSWNQDSANPTVWIAKKQMTKRKAAAAVGVDVGTPAPCADDDPDDHLEPRLPEPYRFEDLEGGAKANPPKPQSFMAKLAAKKRAEPEPAPPALEPLVAHDGRESRELPDWCAEPAAAEALAEGKDKFWASNRYGHPRLLSRDPQTGFATSRWGFDGSLKAGDGEPVVLLNHAEPDRAPWIVVAGPREAIVSHGHYRKSRADAPEKIPHIVAAPPACDLTALARWVKPGEATLNVAWSPRDPQSIVAARLTAAKLRALGHSATVHPPDPEPRQAPRPGRRGP